MIALIIAIIVILVIVGLLYWLTGHLAQLGIPAPVVVAIQILIIIVGILWIVQRAGLLVGVFP